MELVPCHISGKSNETKERTCVPISTILSKIALALFSTLDCKLHQNFENDQNEVKFWAIIVNLLILRWKQKAPNLNDSHEDTLL